MQLELPACNAIYLHIDAIIFLSTYFNQTRGRFQRVAPLSNGEIKGQK